ncbi:MAG: hypothetical protein KIG59_07715 [Muribaculaceae bacterium]|nr:hypothetical protein [Muribaculaceae bacterium]
MVAIFVDKVLRLHILAAVIVHLNLGGVFLDHTFKADRSFSGQSRLSEGKRNTLAPMVEVELSAEEQFKFLKIFFDRPMRQGVGEARHVPSIRESIAD